MAGLTNLTLTWDAQLAEGTKLEFRVENEMFVRTGHCLGELGRKIIWNLPPLTTYNVTVHQVMHNSALLQRRIILSGTVRMANISESGVLL